MRCCPLWPAILAALVCYGPAAAGGARIDMELATEEGFPATASQPWYRLLTELKVDNLRIGSLRGTDKVAVEIQGTESSPVYKVQGSLTSGNELVLPGGRFSLRDRSRISQWLEKLRQQGPPGSRPSEPQPFGLSDEQLSAVRSDLARAVDFDTKGLAVKTAMHKIGAQLKLPLVADPKVLVELERADKLSEELRGLSFGTVLACTLRPAGLVLQPRLGSGGQPEYLVAAPSKGVEAWPLGWLPGKLPRQVLPEMFELRNAEIDEIALSQVLEVIGQRLKVPVLLDHVGLARYNIDPAKVVVSVPPAQTNYDLVLRKVLFQGELKYELRVDEAEKPLLWITTLRSVGGDK